MEIMADIMRSSSFLPTIKCSNCAEDIQIAMMGEHLCSGSVPADESKFLDGCPWVVRELVYGWMY